MKCLAPGRGLKTREMCSDPCQGKQPLPQPHCALCKTPGWVQTQASRQGLGQGRDRSGVCEKPLGGSSFYLSTSWVTTDLGKAPTLFPVAP